MEELQLQYDAEWWQDRRLNPPASDDALARLTASVDVVPPALEALYRWHDGCDESVDDFAPMDNVILGRFLPIDVALAQRREVREIRPDFSVSHLPYAGYNGNADLTVVETAVGPGLGWRGFWDHEVNGPAALEEPLVVSIRVAIEFALLAVEQDP